MRTLRCLIASLGIIILVGGAAFAEADPPSRVARLKYLNGQVSIQPGGVDDWVAASINRPLTTADRVWTDKDSRAELNMGSAAMRMNSETSLTLSNLTDGTVQVELNQGTLNLRVGRMFKGEIYEVDTPNFAFTILKAGNYRFDVDADGDQSHVTVWNGEGEATGNGEAVRVRSHESARFEHGNSLAHQINEAPRADGFDDWCAVRDKREDAVLSSRYVSPDVIGAEDLDEYGTWRDVPTYGPVWVPTAVAPGWAPYRFGHWIWVAPWGWTWVDDAPWGFAPFHYGRWISYGGYWGWCPGPFGVRPIYAPALVGWFGGPRFGVGFGFGGGIGWFPLGFGEPFFPYYHVSRGYFRNVNVSNTRIVNITNVTNNYYNHGGNVNIRYANQGVRGATVVDSRTMVNAQPVGRHMLNVPEAQLRNASLVQRPDATPTAHSMLGAHAGAATTMPPSRVMNRPVVAKMTPPARPTQMSARSVDENRGRVADRPMNNESQRGSVATPRGNVNAGGNAGASVNNDRSRFPASVPRPPDRSASTSQGNAEGTNHSVPRPPTNGQIAERSTGRPGGQNNDAVRGGTSSVPRTTQESRSVPRPPENRSTDSKPAHTESGGHGAKTESGPKGGESKGGESKGSDSKQRSFARPPMNSQGNSTARSYSYPRPTRPTSASYSAPRPPAGQSFSRGSGYSAPATAWRSSGAAQNYASSRGYASRSYSSGGYATRSYSGGGARAQSSGRSSGGGSSSRGGYSSHGGSRSGRAM